MSETPASRSLAKGAGAADRHAPRGGWFDRLLDLPMRLPWSAPVWWIVLLGALILVPSLLIWVTGSQPVGEVQPRVWLPAVTAAYVVAFINIVDGVARSAFDDFSRALGPHADEERLRADLTSLPDRPTFLAVLAIEVIVTAGYFSDPAELGYLTSRPALEFALIVGSSWVSIGLVGVLLVHTLLQLRMIERLHRSATAVDLLDPGPAHAFARVTSATAIGFVLLGVLVLGDPTVDRATPFYAVLAVALTLFAIATFAIPLRGMHHRLERQKSTLLAAANVRIRATLGRIHDSVDGDQLDRSAVLQASLQSLIAERDLVARLSTWPWSTNTFRGFASAVMLPIVIWLLTRLLGRVV